MFTLPHALNPLAMRQPCWLGTIPGFSLALRTWSQDLRMHLPVHPLITYGGLDAEGSWRTPVRGPRLLFPVQVASKVFHGKFLARLDAAHRSGELPDDPHTAPGAWQARRRALLAHDWVVYAKPPPGGPAQVLDYLARYTHSVALSNDRLLGCDAGQVRLRVRDNETGGKRTVSMPTDKFIGRFLRHVLPAGFKRLRHYGLLASGHKRARLSAARVALQTPAPQPVAIEAAEHFLTRVTGQDPRCCPHCGVGRWHTIEIVMARRYDPPAPAPRCRDGPP